MYPDTEREYPEDDLTAWEEEQVFQDLALENNTYLDDDYEPSEDPEEEVDTGFNEYFEQEW